MKKGLTTLIRYLIFILAMLVLAATYNMFLLPNNLVTGGAGGVGIIFKDYIHPSLLIFIINVILIILSYFVLGKQTTISSIIGAISYPLFISLTANVNDYISFSTPDMLLNVLFAAALIGSSIGLIIKYGFSSGGTDIAANIVSKVFKISIGNAFLFIDGFIILSGGFIFGIINSMYALIFIFIYSNITDKIILGTSKNKAFYIITNKEKEIKNHILNDLKHGVTILKGKGGFKDTSKNIVFCVVPVKNYFKLKESINEIDENAFFIVTDAYEVKGGA